MPPYKPIKTIMQAPIISVSRPTFGKHSQYILCVEILSSRADKVILLFSRGTRRAFKFNLGSLVASICFLVSRESTSQNFSFKSSECLLEPS